MHARQGREEYDSSLQAAPPDRSITGTPLLCFYSQEAYALHSGRSRGEDRDAEPWLG